MGTVGIRLLEVLARMPVRGRRGGMAEVGAFLPY
jgi:hypothetical protein